MRWSLLIAVFGLSSSDVASFAQRPPDGRRLVDTRATPQDAGFFASTGVVRFQLLQGRLCLDAPRHRKGSQKRDEGDVYESITVTAQRGIPSMHYVYQTADHHLTLSVQKANALRVESWFPQRSERSVVEQPELGNITWVQSRGDLKEQYEGATLLHIRNSDPHGFDAHYGLLAERLLRGQSLSSLCDATQMVMLGRTVNQTVPDMASIRACVDQLRSKRRSSRIAAERQLLSWGTPIIPTIHRLQGDDLDAEQANRLRAILRRLRPREDDTPATLAKLLVNDPTYWSSIACRLSHAQLRIANQHLERFGAAAIALPDGPEQRIAASHDAATNLE